MDNVRGLEKNIANALHIYLRRWIRCGAALRSRLISLLYTD